MKRDISHQADATPVMAEPPCRFRARVARCDADMMAAHALRRLAFVAPDTECDGFDRLCTHILIEEAGSGTLVCCFRILPLTSGAQIERSYSAQFYDLSALHPFKGPMLELGRFCVHPARQDPDILRVAWGAITRYVDENAVEMLFGCSSFKGTDATPYHDAFAMLKERHLAPQHWIPQIKAPRVYPFAEALHAHKPDARTANRSMPSLLRTYLMMGGWVSDHAVIDPHMNTLHVFTGLEIAAIPAARKRLLRADAQSLDATSPAR